MNPAIVELNDSEVRVARGPEIVLRSPGFAVAKHKELLLGEIAAQQCRLNPRAVYDRFWYRLNQDPITNPVANVRHHADLAHAHLLAIHQQSGRPEHVIFAVPGNYQNEQLALLLGLAAATPFKAVGLVDAAVAAVAACAGEGEYMHVDIHLHKTILTQVRVSDRVTREGVQVIDGAGLSAMVDTCAWAIADLFIKQSRFDPQHLPETEQALYNQIHACLQRLRNGPETMLAIDYQQVQHQVRITSAMLADALQNHYRRIITAIPSGMDCLVSDRVSLLPGFRQQIRCAGILAETCVFQGCRTHVSLIRSSDGGPALPFVTTLPAAASPLIQTATESPSSRTAVKPRQQDRVTHILHNNRAWPLGPGRIYLSAIGGAPLTGPNGSQCCVYSIHGRTEITAESATGIFLNGQQLAAPAALVPGDRLGFAGTDTGYTFIYVQG
ncbi:MAG: hypothetical protein A3I78_08000 [Gammaproteobacteria bacterium RIFCSPLOWO2_02_FULL_56_15]|nr:MAG: hypothetical protein A3I78_08000 [Gammaproteobacteria bacterium RIFCSPLOWO2_02_FULL_56_15]